ncbi:MAG: RNA-binding protein [Vampirovibrionales bacterium]|nr:RNA-binding protein [Vampirovibrionales bacterium]
MSSELFVAQLDWSVVEDELYDLFGQYGNVTSVKIPTDRDTGKKRGFAFVAMSTPQEAASAIEALNNYDLKGRPIVVKIAEPKPARSGGGGGYGGGRGGYGGGRGGYGGGGGRY